MQIPDSAIGKQTRRCSSAAGISGAMRFWYNFALLAGALVGLPFWLLTLIRPKHRASFCYRMGWGIELQAERNLEGRKANPIWIHALSVGEVLSAEAIVTQLRRAYPEYPLVFSASTQTGFATAQRLFDGKVARIFYYPYDLPFSVRHVIDHLRPRLVVIVETDIWPNFLFYLNRRAIPAIWVNARMSLTSFRGYRLLGAFSRAVLNSFSCIGAQSGADADHLKRLGVTTANLVVTGNIKFDQEGSEKPLEEDRELRAMLGIGAKRSIIVLGSTHPGEEMIGLEAFLKLREQFAGLMLIVAPRDPGRAGAVAKLFRAGNVDVGFLSTISNQNGLDRHEALVVNTIGLLRRLYVSADIVYIGGSLVPEGGHNPLEAAACGKPVLFGSDMSDFKAVAQKLEQSGGAMRVGNASALHQALVELLADEQRRQRMGSQAYRVFMSNKGATARTVDLMMRAAHRSRP